MRPERGEARGASIAAVLCALAAWWSAPAAAQQAFIEPSLTGSLTWSDNVGADRRDKGSGFVAEVSPGVAVSREGGRVSGQLNARLRNQVDFSGRGKDTSFLSLVGRGSVEALEKLLFFDLDASVTRDNLSLFAGRARGDALNTDSDSETRSFGVAPRLELRHGDTAATLRYIARWLDGGADEFDRQRLGQWTLDAGNATAFGYLGWGVSYSHADTAYGDSDSPDVTQEIARATLFINATPQLRLRLIGGHESNDYAVRKGESGSITGAGFDWTPNPRTNISATTEKRIFGRGHNVSIDYRRARSAFQLGWSRDITSSLQTLATLYQDPFFRLFYDALAASISDPLEREQAVRELLQALGYGDVGLRDAVIANNYFLDRRLQAGFSLIGVRNVLSLSFTRSHRERLGEVAMVNPQDDLSVFDEVREKTAALRFTHRLSGKSSLNAGLARTEARGAGIRRIDTRRTLFSLGLSTQLSPDTTGSLAYRRQKSAGSSSFTENAITASVFMRF
ncbi:TIGR03016 family PEP-CTERM system-associated outer membrane protein [Pseudothauera rhizosphaerae]|nr:TIGR03016 family PEP-CTERM system-associated outer membrane protein [Pseudothauera rhizosphaerae]